MAPGALLDIIENMLLTPSSDFYLATILRDPAGGALEPRTIAVLDLGTASVEDVDVGVVISNLTITGLSNVQIVFGADGNPEIRVDGSTVTFHARLPNEQPGYRRPACVPPRVEANGELLVSIAGQPMPSGTIGLSVANIQDLTGVFSATESVGGDLSTLGIAFTALSVNPVLDQGNMVITVTLRTAFSSVVSYVLNQPPVQARLLAEVNRQLNEPGILSDLSRIATAQARKAFAAP